MYFLTTMVFAYLFSCLTHKCFYKEEFNFAAHWSIMCTRHSSSCIMLSLVTAVSRPGLPFGFWVWDGYVI